MKVLGLTLGSVSDKQREAWEAAEPNYDHVRSTLDPLSRPPGLVKDEHRWLGHGRAAFEGAARALSHWAPQRHLGASITPDDAPQEVGRTVVLGMGPSSFGLQVPVRVVAVIDEPRRYGFAYGTLPGHPEQGEELFLVDWQTTNEVKALVRVDAVPAHRLRFAKPLIERFSTRAAGRYLDALERAAAGGTYSA